MDEDEQAKFHSRVTFSSESVTINGVNGNSDEEVGNVEEDREGWDNKLQFFMGVISYAVGLGNVWRFPYLCQKNGGGAFLIPYIIMMVLEGMPLFLIEMGIGQRLRTGPVGVWNAIHPYLGGVGVSSAIISFLIGLYYNVIITWCLYYLYKSFNFELPWSKCPMNENGTALDECARSNSPTNYFWNREAIDTSGSIGEFSGFNYHMLICLCLAWLVVYLCVMRGIKSSGKVMYITATFPYIVTTVFLIRSAMLEGAMDGIVYIFTPDLTRLYDPEVWLEAATQIFYSMGLGFGGLVAFGSYNPIKNNCKKDAYLLSAANLATSLYTAFCVFCVLGFMGHKGYTSCIQNEMDALMQLYPGKFASLQELQNTISLDDYKLMMDNKFVDSGFENMANVSKYCDYATIISQAAEGTGLAFVVFTEAILQFPIPPLWSLMFFMMLLMLGLGSMFGTLEGVITSLNDSQLVRLEKPVFTGILCGISCLIGLLFVTKAGQYWVALFDQFTGTYALLCVAFFEIIAVIYVYGYKRFSRDIEFMTGEEPGQYWLITWRFISPAIMLTLFFTTVFKAFSEAPKYFVYDMETTQQDPTPYPTWAMFAALGLVSLAMGPVPFVWFVRKFKIWKVESDIPAAAKCLGTTPSTTYILKSQLSFNRMNESTASELQTLGKLNGQKSTSSAKTSSSNHLAIPNGTSGRKK
uniref:Transporter n=1 Tax=Acrobeloides nanus TaxID=290746 RepID=A0A914E889_9BILA